MMEGMQFKKLMLNVLLADPITVKGKGALTALGFNISELDYLNDLYVEPFTLYNHVSEETLDEQADPDLDYAAKVELKSLMAKKDSFETRLKELGDSLFVIKGGAGSGKTTYVHHLQQEFENIKFCFCDFERSSKAISLFGVPYDFGTKYESNVWKFVSILATKITHVLFSEENYVGFSQHVDYAKAIIETYKQYFSIMEGEKTIVDEQEMWEFFSIIGNYANGKDSYNQFQKKLKTHVVNKFEMLENKKNHKEAVTYMSSILIRLFLCLNRIRMRLGNEKKYVCVIDNIEYFVPFDEEHPIQECELQVILNGVSASISRFRPIIDTWKELFENYETFFGFLLVTRDTSVSIAEYRHYDDFTKESEIDIAKWFCVDDIYETKIDYFEDFLKDLENDPFYKAYRNIIGDMSQYNWGMHDFVCRMYNHNFRRIVFDVVNAISIQPKDDLAYFNDKWEECCNNTGFKATKHMCRKYIFRILLDYIQQSKYFDDLLVEKRNASLRKNTREKGNDKSSYARKIATTLYRVSLQQNAENDNDFVTFPEIIKAVLKPAYLELSKPQQIEDLASILYLMNETRNQKTNWSPLIMIKFDSEQVYNKRNLTLEMKKQWNSYIKNGNSLKDCFKKYGVRITSAGGFFAKMIPDFEYFACRFAPDYPALLVRENLKACRGKDGKDSYKCLEFIKIVRENAFQCIDELLERDIAFFRYPGTTLQYANRFAPLYNRNSPYKWFYGTNINGALIPHPLRILNHQIGYLQHYLEYIMEISEEYLKQEDKEKIIDGIQIEIRRYTEKTRNIKLNNKDYFNLH